MSFKWISWKTWSAHTFIEQHVDISQQNMWELCKRQLKNTETGRGGINSELVTYIKLPHPSSLLQSFFKVHKTKECATCAWATKFWSLLCETNASLYKKYSQDQTDTSKPARKCPPLLPQYTPIWNPVRFVAGWKVIHYRIFIPKWLLDTRWCCSWGGCKLLYFLKQYKRKSPLITL